MAENKFQAPDTLARCVPMSVLQSVLGGKWKLLILWYVAFYKVQRFGELLRRLDGITQSTLTKQLRELEQDGFLRREVYPEVPPKVEYTLTELGESFVPLLNAMLNWSQEHLTPSHVNPYAVAPAQKNTQLPETPVRGMPAAISINGGITCEEH